jgi:ankyrin repeat protein
MLLEVDPTVVLEEDRNADSPLALVWDAWAEKFEGKRTLQPFLHPEQETHSETLKENLKLKSNERLLKKWDTVTLFLRAAFGFHKDSSRTYRALHVTAAIKCHPSLYLLAKALYPEQASEMDDHDLYGPSQESHQTALHLAARSPANGEAGRTVITTLLQLYPQAAQVADGIDGSLPLHRIVENERKVHWNFDGARDLYRAYPLAARIADANGRLPLHRAAAAVAPHPGPASENADGGSIVCSLVEEYPEAASQTDKWGRLPLHYVIAECAEVWDEGVEAILNAHACNRRCPHADVVEALIRAYPDALLQTEEKGMTPLHYACRFKVPKEAVRMLLHLYPTRGHAVVSMRDLKGRTPLYYAVRYEAPPGVVEMLLEVDPTVVLEEDRNADT